MDSTRKRTVLAVREVGLVKKKITRDITLLTGILKISLDLRQLSALNLYSKEKI